MEHSILNTLLKAFSSNGPGFVPLTATAAGVVIPDERLYVFVIPTWVSGSNILLLPPPVPGRIVVIAGASTGGNIQSSSPTTIAINGGAGAAVKSAVAASRMVIAICESATSWKVFGIASDGTVAGLAAAS